MSRRVRFRTYVAFNDPTSAAVWTDVSPFDTGEWSWRYGRQVELDQFQPGSGVQVLDNSDHRFDPLLTSGPYGADVVPMRRMKKEAQWNLLTYVQSSFELNSTAGWSAGSNTTIAASSTVASDGLWSMRLTSSAAGDVSAATTAGTSGFAVVAGEPLVAMCEFRAAVSARSCRVDVRWYDSAGSLISTSAGSTVTSSTGAWTQATVQASAPAPAATAALVAVVQSTGAGSEQHYVDKAAVFPADAGVPAWTRGGPEPVFSGFIPSWEPEYRGGLNGGLVPLQVYDHLAVLAQVQLPESGWLYELRLDAPSSWYRLADADSVMLDSGSTGRHGVHVGSEGVTSLVPSSGNGARSFDGADQRSVVPGAVISGTTFTIEFWVRCDDLSQDVTVFEQGTVASGQYLLCSVRTDGAVEFLLHGDAATFANTDRKLPAGSVVAGAATHIVFTRSGTTFTAYVNGASVTITDLGTGAGWSGAVAAFGSQLVLGTRWADNIVAGFNGCIIDEFAVYTSVLSNVRVAAHYNAGMGWPGSDAGAMIGHVLDQCGVAAGDRDIGVGASIVQPAVFAGANALGYLQQLARTDQGRLWVSPAGKITYRSRWAPLTATASLVSQATFGDQSGELNYSELAHASDVARIINRVVAQRVGGQAIEAKSSTSISRYFERSESVTDLLYTTDGEVVDFIGWRLDHYATAQSRIRALVLDPVTQPDLWTQVLQRSIGDRVTVRKRMADGSQILSSAYLVEGIEIARAEDGRVRCGLFVSSAETRTYLILDDATLGQLDNNALAF